MKTIIFIFIILLSIISTCTPASKDFKWIRKGERCSKGRVCDTLPGTHYKQPVADTSKPVEW